MSIIAGAIVLGQEPLASEVADDIGEWFRLLNWETNQHRCERTIVCAAHLPDGSATEWLDNDSQTGAVAGRMLTSSVAGNDLRHAADAWADGRLHSFLSTASGTFAIALLEHTTGRLLLASDALGGRPIYWLVQGDTMVFSTTRRLLRTLRHIRLTLDYGAIAEQFAAYYPLDDRTIHQQVRVLRDNTILEARPGEYTLSRYWEWDRHVTLGSMDTNEHARTSAAIIKTAIHERHPAAEGSVDIFLSGGLDSRIIAAVLNESEDLQLQARNLSRKGTLDHLLAEAFAATIGARFDRIEWTPDHLGPSAGATTSAMLSGAALGLGPRWVFSGDGGGETLGLLLLGSDTCAHIEAGRPSDALLSHLAGYRPPQRWIRSRQLDDMVHALKHDIPQSLALDGANTSARTFFRHLILNDLRCHLHEYFEDIANSAVELQLPFYDRRLITHMLAIPEPLTDHLHHQYYHKVLEHLPPSIRSVPWQSYPGTPASPLPPPAGVADQWSYDSRSHGNRLAAELLRRWTNGGLDAAIRRRALGAGILLHALRLRDFTYAFKFCTVLCEGADVRSRE